MLSRSFALAGLVSSVAIACVPPSFEGYPVAPNWVTPSLEGLPNRDPSVITQAEIQGFEGRTALDLIKKVRPTFLFSRGATSVLGYSSEMPTIYVDGMRYGPFEMLSQIPASWITEIRLYRSGNAVQFGTNNMGGVLAIKTRLMR